MYEHLAFEIQVRYSLLIDSILLFCWWKAHKLNYDVFFRNNNHNLISMLFSVRMLLIRNIDFAYLDRLNYCVKHHCQHCWLFRGGHILLVEDAWEFWGNHRPSVENRQSKSTCTCYVRDSNSQPKRWQQVRQLLLLFLSYRYTT